MDHAKQGQPSPRKTDAQPAHTPGPWEARSYDADNRELKNSRRIVRTGSPGPSMARVYSLRDAALIAAAPDLLAALRALIDEAQASRRMLQDISSGRAGYATAGHRLTDALASPAGDALELARAAIAKAGAL